MTHTGMPGLREDPLCQLLPKTLLARLFLHSNSNYYKARSFWQIMDLLYGHIYWDRTECPKSMEGLIHLLYL